MTRTTQHGALGAVLLELGLQCDLASYALTRIEAGAKHWLRENNFAAPDSVSRGSPIEILCDCAAFLSAAAAVSRHLYGPRRLRPAQRAQYRRLRRILGAGRLHTVRSRSVRNGFEHSDERLIRRLLRTRKKSHIFAISLLEVAPAGDTLCLRRLNPRTLVLTVDERDLDLRECMQDIQAIKNAIGPVLGRMKVKRFFVYDQLGRATNEKRAETKRLTATLPRHAPRP